MLILEYVQTKLKKKMFLYTSKFIENRINYFIPIRILQS